MLKQVITGAIHLVINLWKALFFSWSAPVNLLLGYQKELDWQEEDADSCISIGAMTLRMGTEKKPEAKVKFSGTLLLSDFCFWSYAQFYCSKPITYQYEALDKIQSPEWHLL